jgi:hypothetical protein
MQFEKEAVIGIPSARRVVLRDRAVLTRVAFHDNSTDVSCLPQHSHKFEQTISYNQERSSNLLTANQKALEPG